MDFSDREFNFDQYKAIFWAQFNLAEESHEIEYAAEKFYDATQADIMPCAALITVLNHKCWDWFEKNNQELSDIYSNLYYKYNEKAWDWLEANGTEEEKDWYFHTMD